MNIFEGVNIEDISTCGTDDFGSGLRTRLYYAPASFFLKLDLPANTGDYYERLLLSTAFIQFKSEECGWAYLDILVEENELKTSLSGGAQRRRMKSSLDIFLLGMRLRVLGFLEAHANTPLVFCIPTADGNTLLLGNLRNRAFIEQANGTTGRRYEDNSGVSATISCNAPLYFFEQDLVIEPVNSEPGVIITPGSDGGGFIDLTQDY